MALALCVAASANAQSAGGETAASEAWTKAAAASEPSVPVAVRIRLSGLSASMGEPENLEDSDDDALPTRADTFTPDAPILRSAPSSGPPDREFMTVAGASNLVSSPPGSDDQSSNSAEIQPASSDQQAPQAGAAPQASPATGAPSRWTSDQQTEQNDTARYQMDADGNPPRQYMPTPSPDEDTVYSTPFGIDLAEARRTLESGEELDGLLIITVHKGSPAATAGLHGYAHGVHDAIAGAAIVGAMATAPFTAGLSTIAVPVIQAIPFGESYDLIIGVDGSRVRNFLDFMHRTRDLHSGEIVYLSVLRDGKRVQVTVPVPADISQLTN
jgi:hypothetical protein